MSFYGLAMSGSKATQYYGCYYGMTDHPYYHKCNECDDTAWCESYKYMQEKKEHDKLMAEVEALKREMNSRILDPKRLP